MQYDERTSGNTSCLSVVLVAVLILVPVVGHIVSTVFIVTDELSAGEKVLWLLLVWLVPFVGIALYLLLGQRRNRLVGSRAM